MALSERAELVARLSLKDDFSNRVSAVNKNFAGSMGKIQKTAIQGAKTTAANVTKIGAIAAGGVVLALRSGINSLVELEDAVTSVDGAIKQVGKGWTTTGQTTAKWANEIEAATEAAFDDKDITAATDNLIRYGKVTEGNLRPAMEVMTDLAAKTGDVESASALLSKALAAPEKAAGKLARVGIVLTKSQQDQIEAMVDAGKAAEAQALLLDILAETTKDAAKASAGPMRDAQNILRDTWEDTTRTLATGALPVLKEVQELLTEELAKPGTVDRVKGLGQGIAEALRGLVGIAKSIPWQQVGDAMAIAGTGAKAVLTAFTSLPPWVQTAVLTGWGLNKLSGGALGTIVGELGKGLIKGVLGMTAGVVHAKAGVVNVSGAIPGAGGTGGTAVAGAAKTGLSTLGKVFLVGEAIGLVLAVNEVAKQVSASSLEQAQTVGATLKESLASPQTASDIQMKLGAIDAGIAKLKADPVAAALITGPTIAELERQRAEIFAVQAAQNATTTAVETMRGNMVQATQNAADKSVNAAERTKGAIDWAREVTRAAGDKTAAAAERTRSAVWASKSAIVMAGHSDAAGIKATIRANRPIVNVAVRIGGSLVTRASGTTVDYRYRDRKYVPIG